MTVGERIKKIREIFEISSNEFAELTGIHPVTIRKYETNKTNPSKEHIDKMCATLRLPRIIFEGIPEQYTDYEFRGDFYQQLFTLYASKTLEYKDKETFKLNPALESHIQISVDGATVPIESIDISVRNPNSILADDFTWFLLYLDMLKKASKIKGKKPEDIEHKKKLAESADEIQLKLMLSGHSWRQYMKGMGDEDNAYAELDRVLSKCGSFYDYVSGLDAPESLRLRLIESFEDTRIAEYVGMSQYPADAPREDIEDWVDKKIELIDQYKKDHPDYKNEIRKEEDAKRSKRL